MFIVILLGYFRLILLAFAWLFFEQPKIFLGFYISQVLLDGLRSEREKDFLCRVLNLAVDGWAARRFNQVSRFGAWLDVIIDNIGRGILWTKVSPVKFEHFLLQ